MYEPRPLHEIVPDTVPHARHVLHFDVETRSPALLKNIGAHRYSFDPRTETVCICFAAEHNPVQLWLPTDPVSPAFVKVAHDPGWIACTDNAVFEALTAKHILELRYGFPPIPPEKFICTMAMALGLPARLDQLANALKLSSRKDSARQRLMLQMSRPRRARKDEPAGIYWFDDPERLQQDVTDTGLRIRWQSAEYEKKELEYLDRLIGNYRGKHENAIEKWCDRGGTAGLRAQAVKAFDRLITSILASNNIG